MLSVSSPLLLRRLSVSWWPPSFPSDGACCYLVMTNHLVVVDVGLTADVSRQLRNQDDGMA